MTNNKKRLKTPELNKIKRVADYSNRIGLFLDWLFAHDIYLHKYRRHLGCSPIKDNPEKLLAKYFKINLAKAEAERDRILKAMQDEQEKTSYNASAHERMYP